MAALAGRRVRSVSADTPVGTRAVVCMTTDARGQRALVARRIAGVAAPAGQHRVDTRERPRMLERRGTKPIGLVARRAARAQARMHRVRHRCRTSAVARDAAVRRTLRKPAQVAARARGLRMPERQRKRRRVREVVRGRPCGLVVTVATRVPEAEARVRGRRGRAPRVEVTARAVFRAHLHRVHAGGLVHTARAAQQKGNDARGARRRDGGP